HSSWSKAVVPVEVNDGRLECRRIDVDCAVEVILQLHETRVPHIHAEDWQRCHSERVKENAKRLSAAHVDGAMGGRGIRVAFRQQSEVVMKPVDLGVAVAETAIDATDADRSKGINEAALYAGKYRTG